MNILRPGSVVGGLLLSSPTMYSALITETIGVDAAIYRFLFGVLVTGVALSILDAITVAYATKNEAERPKPVNPYIQGRRATDAPPVVPTTAMDMPALEPVALP
ncbi:hypothetical protein [Motilibacter aurantiacus]|uniref:hypothetical protein n=1 Tax=Motilibacter aurantiacus TaxID=2714955 RepID=UPI00140DD928|nr:hypothetical protein [Motilibacter aurantiacus]NHC47125.1 hypothetical protein [Motilibacter aurantiacus]